jgi:hypothetical protein
MTTTARAIQPHTRLAEANRTLKRVAAWGWARPWLALPFLALPALWPFWTQGLPQSPDGPLHLLRLVLLDYHVRQGMLFPRWLPELALGHGYPILNYYGAVSYYLAEALRLLGFGYQTALMAVLSLFILAGGAGAYALAAALFGPRQRLAALVAAVAYLYNPYFLTNIYVRGAVAEAGAAALLPWLFWATARLLRAKDPAPWIAGVAVTLGGLAVMHSVILLFTIPLWPLYVLALCRQDRLPASRLARVVGGGLAALGLSAFFWLPMLAERGALSALAYRLAAPLVAANAWTWGTFLDTSLAYRYTFDTPYRLGLAQLALAVLGLCLGIGGWVAHRRDSEGRSSVVWLLFLLASVAAGLGISQSALPLWLGSPLLLMAQFPWRLLAVMGLPLALFTGGWLLYDSAPWLPLGTRGAAYGRAALAIIVLTLIITANRPRLDWMSTLPRDEAGLGLPSVAQVEADTGALGTGSIREYWPRWSDGIVLRPDSAATPDTPLSNGRVTLEQANAYGFMGSIESAGGPLRLTTFYFPGWRVTLDGNRSLPIYPSTNLGLLTVDVPAGRHAIQVSWQGTELQHAAGAVTLLTLAVGAVFYLRRRRWRALGLLCAGLCLAGAGAALVRPAWQPVHAPAAPVASDGVSLLAYRTEADGPNALLLFPYWYVRQTPTAAFRVRWQLLDAQGQAVNEITMRPYFNSASASDWPPGTVVNDAYRLALPPQLPAGAYRLAVQMQPAGTDTGQPPVVIGDINVATLTPRARRPAYPLNAHFGPTVRLAGYELSVNGKAVVPTGRAVSARPGDVVEYTLYWQATGPISEDYHGFVHLLNLQGQPLIQRDQLAGPLGQASRLWDAASLQPDLYRLRIPADAAGGLYWPSIGLYDFSTRQPLPASAAGERGTTDPYLLPALKVIGPSAAPQHPLTARFGDMATLIGYDLALPAGGVHPGSQLTLTLYYRSETVTTTDYTRFIHLYDPTGGMAAQNDAVPGNGNNPTSAWIPGEIITEQAVLTVAVDARAGPYELRTGFYDPGQGAARLPATDARGRPLPDAQVILTQIDIRP